MDTPELINDPVYVEFDAVPGVDGKKLVRAQAGFHANGCARMRKILESTGKRICYMYCKWPELASATLKERGLPIQTDEFDSQTNSFISAITSHEREVQRADMYIAGSHLNEDEMDFETLEKICRKIAEVPTIQEIAIESRIDDLTDEKLDRLNALATETGTKAIVGLGVETTNDKILKLAKKGIDQSSIKEGIEMILDRENVVPQAYLLIKPTVMSERGAVEQAVEDIQFLSEIAKEYEKKTGVKKRIMINIAPVQPIEGTGAALNDAYHTLSLWSVIEIIKRLDRNILENVGIFFVLTAETGIEEEKVTSCEKCEKNLQEAISQFNETQNPAVVTNHPDCSCKAKWDEKIQNEPFVVGSVYYPYDENNPAAVSLFDQQLDGIMKVEREDFPDPEIQASRETMEYRIKSSGGNVVGIAYHPKTGEIVAFSVSGRISKADLDAIPEDERGWDNLNKLPLNIEGNFVKGISTAKRRNAPKGAAWAAGRRAMFECVEELGLIGSVGTTRLPGLSRIKSLLEKDTGEEISKTEILEIGQQYLDAHLKRFSEPNGKKDKSDIEISFQVKGKKINLTCPLDPHMKFWGRMGYTKVGPVVFSMEGDSESCNLGVVVTYMNTSPTVLQQGVNKRIGELCPT
jgi:radical SAM enzyme (TIGR01210 family)